MRSTCEAVRCLCWSADLGVGDLTAGEAGADEGEVRQSAGDADALVGGAEVQADAPGEPFGAGLETVAPAGEGVELAELVEEASHGDLDVGGQLGELVTEALGGDDGGMPRGLDQHVALLACDNSRGRFRRGRRGALRGDLARGGISGELSREVASAVRYAP